MATGPKKRVHLISGSRLGHRLLHFIRGRRFDQSISPFLSISVNPNCRDICASMGLKLLYWNCKEICSRREELRKLLEEIDVFIGVATNLKKQKI